MIRIEMLDDLRVRIAKKTLNINRENLTTEGTPHENIKGMLEAIGSNDALSWVLDQIDEIEKNFNESATVKRVEQLGKKFK